LDNANGHCAVLGHQRLKLQLISSSSLQLTSFLIPAYDQGNKIVGTKGHPRLSNIFILITGCSGGGKSTLLDALGAKGYGTIPEPGRRIVASEIAGSGKNLPWVDMEAFAQSALNMARSDLKSAKGLSGTMFFDRGVVDAAVALQAAGGAPFGETLGSKLHYTRTVFLAPPWPEIFLEDQGRRHDFRSASEEYHRVKAALDDLGYYACVLPRASVEDRVAFVLNNLASVSQ
jgi:predicted ATPase